MVDEFKSKSSLILRKLGLEGQEGQWVVCCTILWSLIGLNLFDGLGLSFGGIDRNSAPENLFLVSYVPTMYQGAFLILLSILHAYGIGARNRVLDIGTMLGAVYYGLWAFGIFWSWFFVEISSLGLFSKSAFLCVLYLIVARYSSRPQ